MNFFNFDDCYCLQVKQHLENNRAYKQDYKISAVSSNLLFAKIKQTVCERLYANKSLLNTFQKLW